MVQDRFKEYYTEKLWEMIPTVYRHEDGLGVQPGVLRGLVEVLATQAAILRRSQDRLWEDQFIDLCDDWAVPYLADLVSARLVSAKNRRGQKIDVAKTIYYRRRKGTVRVLEELISDITGWEGTVRENFRRLGRAWHKLDPLPLSRSGRLTGTAPGGWADLHKAYASELADSAFDEFHHTPDVRKHRGNGGRYGIPKLAFHLYRIPAWPLVGVQPKQGPSPHGFHLDPSGRDIPLFMPRQRVTDYDLPPFTIRPKNVNWDVWRPAFEWELPAPLLTRILNHAEYLISERVIRSIEEDGLGSSEIVNDLRTLREFRIPNDKILISRLSALPSIAALPERQFNQFVDNLMARALVKDCGKYALLPRAFLLEVKPANLLPPTPEISPQRIIGGNLKNWTPTGTGQDLLVDPERGRVSFVGGLAGNDVRVNYWYGFSGTFGAGGYSRARFLSASTSLVHISGGGSVGAEQIQINGVTQIDDSSTYDSFPNLAEIQNATIQAAEHQRPFLILTRHHPRWEFSTPPGQDATVTLEGLWIGSQLNAENPSLVLHGDYECVLIQHTTLDPGGSLRSEFADCDESPSAVLPPVQLVIKGTVETLIINNSIVGPIHTDSGGSVERLSIRNSIVQSINANTPAIALPFGAIELGWPRPSNSPESHTVTPCGVTVFGSISAMRLQASEALITGIAEITDTQTGCFRFSAASVGSRVPRAYESHTFLESGHFFTSHRFGDPGFGQLSASAPSEIFRGAENGSEIGAFSCLNNPIRADSLRAKVEEYMPFGLVPLYINET